MATINLIDKQEELFEFIELSLKPKEIEKKDFGEVFTPIDFINNKMLKDIEEYWLKKYKENIWSNDKLTWYDPSTGIGNYAIAIYYKLLDGIKKRIPDIEKRKKHIIENMLYMGEINKKNCDTVRQIFNKSNTYKLNLYEGDTLKIDIKKVFNKVRFDIIIGNPPYNESFDESGAKPLYHKFIEYYIEKCQLLSYIVPSRWFVGGKGLDKFRKMMLSRTDIVYIQHIEDATTIFGKTVRISGGVNYFLIDRDYNGLCKYNNSSINLSKYDILVDNKYCSLIEKLDNSEKLTKIYLGRYFGIESNDSRLKEKKKGYIKCYVSQFKGFEKYVDKNEIKREYNFYKVITARASQNSFGNKFIGTPDEVHTGSYISFKAETKEEAESLLSYLKCKLPNLMLSLRKIAQDISESSCKWIPLPPLDRIWTNEEVYKYYNLSTDDIKLISEIKLLGYNDYKEEKAETDNEEENIKVKPKRKVKNDD